MQYRKEYFVQVSIGTQPNTPCDMVVIQYHEHPNGSKQTVMLPLAVARRLHDLMPAINDRFSSGNHFQAGGFAQETEQ